MVITEAYRSEEHRTAKKANNSPKLAEVRSANTAANVIPEPLPRMSMVEKKRDS